MLEKVLSGKAVAKQIKLGISSVIQSTGIQPRMALLRVGSDPASAFYVDNIIKQAQKLACEVVLEDFPSDIAQDTFLQRLQALNTDPTVDGIMIQKPLPKQIDDNLVNSTINPLKDIDSLNPLNLGKLILETDGFIPCTPYAVFLLMRYYGIDPMGKNTCILGRSAVVGKPLANILLGKKEYANATVTVCHSRTKDLINYTRAADILISAIGVAHFVKEDMVKKDAVLIDVGINEITDPNGKSTYVGDIEYTACYNNALALTPVPGGIGTITTSVLLMNLLKAALYHKNENKIIDDFYELIFNAK